METNIIFTVAQIIILAATAWFSLRRVNFQNSVDDSTAAKNYRELVVTLQAEVKELKEWKDNSHLEIEMSIEMGNAPIIKHWEWKPRADEKKDKIT